MLADKALNHQPLIINGSPDFHKAVLQVALENNLFISFQDKLMQGTFEMRKREQENERRNFLANGGIIIFKHPKSQSRIHSARAKTIIGMMSDGQHHPHVNIMFSERLIDEVEKINERSARVFFLYPARKKKDGSQPSFEEKWKRGAPKDRKWCNRQYVIEMRADFAQIQNEVLERNGFSIRVDHRSLKD